VLEAARQRRKEENRREREQERKDRRKWIRREQIDSGKNRSKKSKSEEKR
jgi:hypothetical protein